MNEPFETGGVLRDDALLDAIGRGELPPGSRDDATALLLLGWRTDLVTAMPTSEPATVEMPLWFGPSSTPLTRPDGPEPLDRRPRRLRRKNLVLAVAITVAGIGSAGGVAAAGTAEPGDPLWPIVRVVDPERAESLEAREDARLALNEVRRAAGAHEPLRAQEYLRIAQKQTDKVRSQDGRAELDAEARRLQEEIAEIDSSEPSPQPGQPSTAPSPTEPVSPSPETSPTPVPPPPSPTDPPPSPSPSAAEITPQGNGDAAAQHGKPSRVPPSTGSNASVNPNANDVPLIDDGGTLDADGLLDR